MENNLVMLLIAMLCVYGFYCILDEIRGWFRRLARRKKENVLPPEIDKIP